MAAQADGKFYAVGRGLVPGMDLVRFYCNGVVDQRWFIEFPARSLSPTVLITNQGKPMHVIVLVVNALQMQLLVFPPRLPLLPIKPQLPSMAICLSHKDPL